MTFLCALSGSAVNIKLNSIQDVQTIMAETVKQHLLLTIADN
jgi:hypothetical protein